MLQSPFSAFGGWWGRRKKRSSAKRTSTKMLSRVFPGCPVVKISPSNARGSGSIPGQGAKIPYASWPKNQNIKQKQYYNKCHKDLKIVHIKKKIRTKTTTHTPKNIVPPLNSLSKFAVPFLWHFHFLSIRCSVKRQSGVVASTELGNQMLP